MDKQELVNAIYSDITHELAEQDKKVEEWTKMVLYTYAVPQIKGDITKGKLKWRGIKLVAIHNNWGEYSTTYEITQRGKLLGNFVVDCSNFRLQMPLSKRNGAGSKEVLLRIDREKSAQERQSV